jgi:hypothetical protein
LPVAASLPLFLVPFPAKYLEILPRSKLDLRTLEPLAESKNSRIMQLLDYFDSLGTAQFGSLVVQCSVWSAKFDSFFVQTGNISTRYSREQVKLLLSVDYCLELLGVNTFKI